MDPKEAKVNEAARLVCVLCPPISTFGKLTQHLQIQHGLNSETRCRMAGEQRCQRQTFYDHFLHLKVTQFTLKFMLNIAHLDYGVLSNCWNIHIWYTKTEC